MAEENQNQQIAQQNTQKTAPKSAHAEREEKVLKFWNEKGIFQKSVDHPASLPEPKGDFVFYDGPPFATGLPHFGHILPTSIKDAIPRYKTMQGFRVRRRWGWDCHGLPVENLIEKELGLKTKKDIIDYGIGKFNAAARASVMRHSHDWKTIIPRLGRWVDMENDYQTMDSTYTESVWWAFKTLYEKNLILESFKAMQICPHCETTLANFEVNQGYKDITDISVYAKFELADESGVYFIAWTTTPWTLPGNVALAVGPEIEYVKVKTEKGTFILAKDRLAHVLKDLKYEVLGTMKGSEFAGGSYKPIFDYYAKDSSLKNHKNGWKVYVADFVTTTDGTGIVHIAPAFGADDMELGKKYELPFVQHVGMDGRFKKEVTDFAGVIVKPKSSPEEKDAHQKGDVEIIKKLGPALFAKEKIVHSYPHCWRCDTPLLNYATTSWFVKVPEITNKLVSENKKVNWVPKEVGEGRFGNWLLGSKEWAISRSRFWGAPLPVWRTKEDAAATPKIETVVVGSLADLKKYSKPQNEYFLVRHGEAENNTKGVISSKATVPHHLTETGKTQAEGAAEWLVVEHAKKPFDFIYVSPFIRTRETAVIIAKKLGIDANKILIEPKIGELNAGDYDTIPFKSFIEKFQFEKRFDLRPPNGENYCDVKKRMGDFIYGLEKKYSGKDGGKRILIVSHDSPLSLLVSVGQGLDRAQTIDMRGRQDHYILNAKPFRLDFTPLPHNEEYELDLHRPYIDDFKMKTVTGRDLFRIEEVFDCWFESGSMPFGEAHYPFCNEDDAPAAEQGVFQPKSGLFKKSKGYPADFIAEGQDQTRGWFYSLLVLGVALFGKAPYKNVVVNGIVLAEDGQKLSKSKKNYPDLMPVVDKYSADALRFYLLASPLVRAQEFAFAERGVDEVAKKHIGRLANVVTFYEMYANPQTTGSALASSNILDRWMMARLAQLIDEVTKGLEAYELDRAARPFADFIDDLSTWYLRRSRDRFKDAGPEKDAALASTRTILLQTAKLLAPFMPFLAEDIHQRVKGADENVKESVHLEAWPVAASIDQNILKNMAETRRLASVALEARMKAKINVRQPLAKLSIKKTPASAALTKESLDLIIDEINVKMVAVTELAGENEVELDLTMTPELKEEGNVRELIRVIQDLRKKENLTISDLAKLKVITDEPGKAFIERNTTELMKVTGLSSITCIVEFYGGEETAIDTYRFGISLS
jgi:isoleucyl-tRNA synthetase